MSQGFWWLTVGAAAARAAALRCLFLVLSALCLAACGAEVEPVPGHVPGLPEGTHERDGLGYPEVRDLLVLSPEIGIGAPVFGAAGGGKLRTAIAFGGTQYLVAWQDSRATSGSSSWNFEIYAARVALDGTVLDPYGIRIGRGMSPVIAFDGTRFLVAYTAGESCDVCGARVDAGGAVLDPGGIAILTDGFGGNDPAIAFDGTNFVVAFSNHDKAAFARVTPSGVVLDPGGVTLNLFWGKPAIASNGAGSLLIGRSSEGLHGMRISPAGAQLDPTGFQISPAGSALGQVSRQPALAFDGTNHVAVWGAEDDTGFQYLGAARVSPAGVVLDPAGILLHSKEDGSFSEISATYNGESTSIFWAPDYGEMQEFGLGLHHMRLGTDGAVLDPAPIALDSAVVRGPACASDGTSAFVTWVDPRDDPASTPINPDIVSARIGQDGMQMGSTGLLSTGGNEQLAPSLAWGDELFFVAWIDGRPGDSAIYGARVTPEGELLDPSGIELSAGKGWRYPPRVVFDGSSFLVLWPEAYYLSPNGTDDPPIRAVRVSSDGVVLDAAPITLPVASSPFYPPAAAASDGTGTLVVTQVASNLGPTRLFAVLLDPQGVPGPVLDLGFETDLPRSLAIDFDGSNYLVVLEQDNAIVATRISPQGEVLDPGGIVVAPAADFQCGHGVGFDGQNHVVLWRAHDGIHATRISPSGDVLAPQDILVEPAVNACSGVPNQMEPLSVAFGGDRSVVLWSAPSIPGDPRSFDVRAAEVSPGGDVLAVSAISTGLAAGGSPVLASAGVGQWLAIYTRFLPEAPFSAVRVYARTMTPCDDPLGCSSGTGSGGAGGAGGGAGGAGGGAGGGDEGTGGGNPADPTEPGDCSYRAGGSPQESGSLLALALAGVLACRRRRSAL